MSNTYTEAEKFAAETIAKSVRDLSNTCVDRYAPEADREAASEALSTRVAEMLLGEVYAAGEAPIPGITVERLADVIRNGSSSPVDLVKNIADVPAAVALIRFLRSERGRALIRSFGYGL